MEAEDMKIAVEEAAEEDMVIIATKYCHTREALSISSSQFAFVTPI